MMPFRNSICYYWKGKIYNQENDSLLKQLTIRNQISDVVEDRHGSLLLVDPKMLNFITPISQFGQ
ncbi:hypothetical protein [Paraflavitalea speifideaquila]|uniref:hypothetical protein n=1 Tax=Paraflavitalea speifideaquila TaxID=3076558 RepID=UPI0028E48E61|nr:hypothetical protein [Paraflavitalea speifideiaquila]